MKSDMVAGKDKNELQAILIVALVVADVLKNGLNDQPTARSRQARQLAKLTIRELELIEQREGQ